MSNKDRILAIIEMENSPDTVVERAAWIAKLVDCDLELLLCEPAFSPLGYQIIVSNEAREIARNISELRKETIENFANTAREMGITVTTDVLEERPIADGILAKAINMDPRFIVKGTHYHSAADRGIMIDTDWQLIRTSPYPLWLVKREEFRKKPVIIAAVDPTHEHDKPMALDQAIIDAAKTIADPTNGEVHLLHTYERLIGIGKAANRAIKSTILPIDELEKRIQETHRTALNELAEKNGFDDKHTHQLPGKTREILPTYTRSKNADLVVMGALARWGIKRMVVGSTAERVLDHLPCDVLIVRPE
ncbi:MAG: universal stress protein [Woeseiaceae bacterium]